MTDYERWKSLGIKPPKLAGCTEGCGARFDVMMGLVSIAVHSEGCPNRPPDNTGTLDEVYWWPRKEEKR